MLCDCKNDHVVDADRNLCQQCLVELELTQGKFCLAYAERARQRQIDQMWEEFEAERAAAVPTVKRNPAQQASPNAEPIRPPVPNKRWGRRL